MLHSRKFTPTFSSTPSFFPHSIWLTPLHQPLWAHTVIDRLAAFFLPLPCARGHRGSSRVPPPERLPRAVGRSPLRRCLVGPLLTRWPRRSHRQGTSCTETGRAVLNVLNVLDSHRSFSMLPGCLLAKFHCLLLTLTSHIPINLQSQSQVSIQQSVTRCLLLL